MYKGYIFYFEYNKNLITLPITPSELSIKVDSKNKVINLISGGDINILKSPSLIEVEFEARFPMRQYPYARKYSSFETYWETFKKIKVEKKPVRFVVSRTTPNGTPTWNTDLLMAIESMQLEESVDNGDDVIITFKLKQYEEYGVKKLPNNSTNGGGTNGSNSNGNGSTSTSSKNRTDDGKGTKATEYTVKNGDCLWAIAKAHYGDGSKYTKIYEANKKAIEDEP